MHTDLPRKQSQPAPTGLSKRSDHDDHSLYEGFPGDGLGDSNSQPPSTTVAPHATSHSVDFEHLLQRRHARLISAKAELLSLKARTMASIAAEGMQPSVAMDVEQRVEGVQEDLKTLVKLLLLNSEAEEVLNNEHCSCIYTFQICLWSSACLRFLKTFVIHSSLKTISPASHVNPRLCMPPIILYAQTLPHFNLVTLKTRARMTVPGRAQQSLRESVRSATPWCSPLQDGLSSRYPSLQFSSC